MRLPSLPAILWLLLISLFVGKQRDSYVVIAFGLIFVVSVDYYRETSQQVHVTTEKEFYSTIL